MLECDFVLEILSIMILILILCLLDLVSSGYYGLIRSTEEELEAKLGFDLFFEGKKKLGLLLTFTSVS